MNIERALLENPALRVLRPAEISALADAMTIRRVKAGTEIIVEGARDQDLYVVMEGVISMHRRPTEQGELTELGELGPGAMIGLVALLDPGPRSTTCTAKTDVVLAVLPYSAFSLLYRTSTGFSVRFRFAAACQVSDDLIRLTHRLVDARNQAARR